MDRISVESRLNTLPARSGEFTWQADTLIFQPVEPWPVGWEITVTLAAGARSSTFLPILSKLTWSFEVGEARLAYLWPSSGAAEIYLLDPEDGRSSQISDTEDGVLDYAAAGTRIVYTALLAQGGSEIRGLDLPSGEDRLIVACPDQTRCLAPVLAPNELLVAYEQFEWESTESGQRVPGASQIWLLPLRDEAEPIAVPPAGQQMSSPTWTPAGLLAFYNESLQAIALFEPRDLQPLNMIPNNLGLLGSWSPDGQFLVIPEIVFPSGTEAQVAAEPVFFSHLYLVDVYSSEVKELSLGLVEDASPAYSPDGEWIAFARKYLDSRWTPGRQLWLMRSDGSAARPLTQEPDFSHSSVAWSPDSSRLAYMRLSQAETSLAPEIWITDLQGEQHGLLVEGGYLPQWIP